MTDLTDKNVALAKECGAMLVYNLAGIAVVQLMDGELDEYTSRVCHDALVAKELQMAELSGRQLKQIAEKDALIAMQAEALKGAIHALRFAGAPMSLLESLVDARSATAETVEAWKNRQGDEK